MLGWVRRAVAAAGSAAALAVAGCAPAGVDGDLTGDWSAFPELTQMRPEAGVCHNVDYEPTVELGIYYQPRECAEPHQIETAHVFGTIFDYITEEDWENGDRGFRCYLWSDGEDLTGSLAGGGS